MCIPQVLRKRKTKKTKKTQTKTETLKCGKEANTQNHRDDGSSLSTSWTKDHPRRLRHTSRYLHRGVPREACLRTDPLWCDWHQLYARGQWEWAGRGRKAARHQRSLSSVSRLLWCAFCGLLHHSTTN